MKILITPRRLAGTITVPPSKSIAHRLLICAALADGVSLISNLSFSVDIKATLQCIGQIGARWKRVEENTIEIYGSAGLDGGGENFECCESGSTLRFFIPIALALCGGGRFTGKARLMRRPQGPYFDLFMEKNISFSYEEDVLSIKGELKAGTYSLRGDVSSQFFSGLLFALPLLSGDSILCAATKLESAPYVEMTREAQRKAKIYIERESDCYKIKGGSAYAPFNAEVEADWSQAAFWYMANQLGSRIELRGMDCESIQGDRASGLLMANTFGNSAVKEAEFDISDCPDLLPPAAAAAAARGEGTAAHFCNAARLRIKESDRLSSVAYAVNALGGRAVEERDGITIYGKESLSGGVEIPCRNDHRIAMMAAIAATRCEKPVVLDGAECVDKSYPNFWKDYIKLGGVIEEL